MCGATSRDWGGARELRRGACAIAPEIAPEPAGRIAGGPELCNHSVMKAAVVSVSVNADHTFSKQQVGHIRLLAGLGVEGDAHCGVTVKHRSHAAKHPDHLNLRQVHLVPVELFGELAEKGFAVDPGDIGENVTTRGIDLLALPAGTELQLGPQAVVRVTGLRNPCSQLDGFRPGLTTAVLDRAPDGTLMRKAGVMAIVVSGGIVSAGDPVGIRLPPEPHHALDCV